MKISEKLIILETEKKKILDPSLYSDPHQKLMGSILVREPSSIQISLKSVK